MTTFADVQAHMRANYKLQDDTQDMLSMVWTYEEGRRQRVVVRHYEAAGRHLVEFKSPFARRGEVEPESLLQENSKLLMATIALSGDVYLVIYNALLEHLDLGDLDFMLARVAGVADTLEERYVRRDEF